MLAEWSLGGGWFRLPYITAATTPYCTGIQCWYDVTTTLPIVSPTKELLLPPLLGPIVYTSYWPSCTIMQSAKGWRGVTVQVEVVSPLKPAGPVKDPSSPTKHSTCCPFNAGGRVLKTRCTKLKTVELESRHSCLRKPRPPRPPYSPLRI